MSNLLRKLVWFAPLLTAVAVAFAQKPVTIEYWHINTESFGGPAVRELVAEFQRRNPGIRVEERFHHNAYTGLLQNLQAALAAGNPPDVAQIGYLFTDHVAENFPFVPITDLARRHGGGERLLRFPPDLLALGQVGGVQMGLPYSLSNIVVYYNADLFRRAGLSAERPPLTWEEWRQAARQIKARTGKAGIYLILLDDNWGVEGLIASNGGSLLACGPDGHYRAGFDGKESAEALRFWADLVKEGLAVNALLRQGEASFLAGEVAAMMTTIAKRAAFEEQTRGRFELRGAPFPRFGEKPSRLPGGGNVLTIFAKDPARQQAAWRFVEFLSSAEGFTLWTKGTGYVPLLAEIATDARYLKDFIAKNPIQQIGVEQLPNTIRWTSFPGSNGLAASQALFRAVQRALGGEASPEAALRDAALTVNGLIKSERCSKQP